jgi:glycosyltransferase involved in cell wall biosynthesis
MRILIFNRLDPLNQRAGGAETFTGELVKRLVADGNEVVWFASGRGEQKRSGDYFGCKIVRKGNVLTVLFWAMLFYLRKRKAFDLVVDEIHAYPFFTKFFVEKRKRLSLVHEVTGEIWYYMLPFPLANLGNLLEKIMYRYFYNDERFLVVSKSTKKELIAYGAKAENIHILSEGISLSEESAEVAKSPKPTLVFFGGMRPTKRVEHQLAAVKILKKEFPYLKLFILGKPEGRYYLGLQGIVRNLGLQESVEFTGFLNRVERDRLIRASWLTLNSSVKEGWGLAVSEAGALGTPAVVYNTPGNVDSVLHLLTGLHTIENNPERLALGIKKLLLDEQLREKLAKGAKLFSSKLSWDKSYQQLKQVLTKCYSVNG